MLGDAQTISDDGATDESPSHRPVNSWPAPTVNGDDGETSASLWPISWAAEPTVSSPDDASSETAEWGEPDVAPARNGFAGWGALSNIEATTVTHDLSEWDSPTDADLASPAETQPTVWPAHPSDETTAAAAVAADWVTWPTPLAPATQESWSTEPAVSIPDWAGATSSSPSALSAPEDHTFSQWSTPAPDLGPSAEPTERTWAPLLPDRDEERNEEHRFAHWAVSDVEVGADEHVGIEAASTPTPWIDTPPSPSAPLAPVSFDLPTFSDEGQSSGVPFHEIAAAFASGDVTPIATREVAVPVADSATSQPIDGMDTVAVPTPKRRGRLASRKAAQAEPRPAADELEPVDGNALTIEPDSEANEDADSDSVGTSEAPRRGFFAKRSPEEAKRSPRESPKELRIAALVSLCVGIGLFGFTVINSRSSDTKPDPAPSTVPAAVAPPAITADPAPAPPSAPSATAPASPTPSEPAKTSVESADPLFGTPPTPSAPVESSSVDDSDPLFGSAQVSAVDDPASTPVTAAPTDDLVFDEPIKASNG